MHLLDLFLPPRCIVKGCARRGSWFCDSCATGIERPGHACCARCLDAESDPLTNRCSRCTEGTHAFDQVYAAGLHEPPLRDLVHALKYRRVRPVASELAALISVSLPPMDRSTLIVPVPSHRRRVRDRGIDPARLIARRLAERRSLKLESSAIVRTRHTAPQVQRSNAARSENVHAAFTANKSVSGRRVLLIDDVMTTGATSNECARALLQAGASCVSIAVAARATTPFGHGSSARRGV